MTQPRRHDPDDLSPEQEAALIAEAERGPDPSTMQPRRLGHRGNRLRIEDSIRRRAQHSAGDPQPEPGES